jgi:hypothetical protein
MTRSRVWIGLLALSGIVFVAGFLVGKGTGRAEGIKSGRSQARAETWAVAERRAELVQLRAICTTGARILLWIEETRGIGGDPSGSERSQRLYRESALFLDALKPFIELRTASEIRDAQPEYFKMVAGDAPPGDEYSLLCEPTPGGGSGVGIVPSNLRPEREAR